MPSAVSASRTSSSLKGLKIAITNFIASPGRQTPSHLPTQSACQRKKPVETVLCARRAVPKYRALAERAASCHFARMAEKRFDLAVVGAGLNGSLLALAAGEAGLDTALIDRVPLASLTEAGFDGRTTAIAYTSQRLFAALGVWAEVADQAEPILDIRISDAGHDGRPSPLFLHFDHREAAPEDGEPAPMGWIVENRFLRAAVLRRLAACRTVELIAPDEVIETTRDPDRAELALK